MRALDADLDPRSSTRTREEIDACNDVELLARWFDEAVTRAMKMRAFIKSFRDADVNDEDWFRRIAGALGYVEVERNWAEKRILELGGTVPYWPTDPRSRALRMLNEKVEKLTKRVRELEMAATSPSELEA